MSTYPIQTHCDLSTSIDGSFITTQLNDFANNAHVLVSKLLQVGCCYTWGCLVHCGCICVVQLVEMRNFEEFKEARLETRLYTLARVVARVTGRNFWLL